MGCCPNNVQSINYDNNGCNNRNMIIIVAAIVALILVNILDDDATECIGQLLQSIGDLMTLAITGGCFRNLGNNNSCNYY